MSSLISIILLIICLKFNYNFSSKRYFKLSPETITEKNTIASHGSIKLPYYLRFSIIFNLKTRACIFFLLNFNSFRNFNVPQIVSSMTECVARFGKY